MSFFLHRLSHIFLCRFSYIVSVWLNPSVATDDNLDHRILFDIHRKAMSTAIHKAMNNKPDIDWLLENQEKVIHKYFQMGLDGKI